MSQIESGLSAKPPSTEKQTKAPTPWWAWIFAGLCALIPIVTLGGAIPAVIGLTGASGCLGVARRGAIGIGARIVICFAIAAGCWVLFLGLGVAYVLWQSPKPAP